MILRHFGANSAGTFKASYSYNKNFGITQPERLVKLWNHSAREAGEIEAGATFHLPFTV
jgi:hypothetical protein